MLQRAAKQDWQDRQAQTPRSKRSAWDETPEFLAKVHTDYLRHEASNYDEIRAFFIPMKLSARTLHKLTAILQTEVHSKIAELYPHLANECHRQCAEKQRTHRVA